jgi:hypothetical protein
LKSQSDLAFASSGCFFKIVVIINTSDISGAKIMDSYTNRGW